MATFADLSAGLTFKTVKRDRTSRQIVAQLESAILRGQYRLGDRLPTERELAEQFGTSRSSVREALRSLEQIGLVVVRQGAGGGAFVSTPSAGLLSQTLHRLARLGEFDSTQLYAARRVLEPGIAAEAATRAAPEQIAELEATLAEVRALVESGADTAPASRHFHVQLAEATGNALLVLLNAALMDLAARLDQAIPHQPRPAHLVVDEHQALVAALKSRDPEKARELAHEHLTGLDRQTASEQMERRA